MNDLDDAPTLRTSTILRVLLDVLAARSLKWLTMLLAFALCVVSALRPHWTAFASAVLFVALVCPVWWRREKRDG